MTKFTYLAIFLMVCSIVLRAQDEGTIVKRERIERSSNIFVSGGPSFTLGKNIGDYSTGFSIDAGYQKRLNRVLSIGPSFSYLSFKYDPEVTNINGSAYLGVGDPGLRRAFKSSWVYNPFLPVPSDATEPGDVA